MVSQYVVHVNKQGECYSVNGKPGKEKGVYLSNEEVAFLELLYVCRFLPSNLAHHFFKSSSDTPSRINSISRRLKKLVDEGILYRKAKVLGNNLPQYFYYLKQNGYEVLHYLGVIKEQWDKTKERALFKKENYSAHTMTGLAVIVDTYKMMQRQSVNVMRGVLHPLFCKWDSIKKENRILEGIVPDYVLESKDRIICLEHDMKSENISRIRAKNRMYIDLATKGITKKELIVVYGIYGGREETEMTGAKRVHSIMGCLPPSKEWRSHIQFYVANNSYASKLMVDLLKEELPIGEMRKGVYIDSSIELLKRYGNVEPIDMNKLIHAQDEAYVWEEDVDYAFRIFQPGKAPRTFVLMTMTLGNVESYQKASRMYKQIYNTNYAKQRNEYVPVELLVALWNDYEAKEVLLPFTPSIPIHSYSYKYWSYIKDRPVSYMKTSPYKKEKGVLVE